MESQILTNEIAFQFLGGKLEVKRLHQRSIRTIYFGQIKRISVKKNILRIRLAWLVETKDGYLDPDALLNGFYTTYKLRLNDYSIFGIGDKKSTDIIKMKYYVIQKVGNQGFCLHLPPDKKFSPNFK